MNKAPGFFYVVLLGALLSCNDETNDESTPGADTSTNQSSVPDALSPLSGCYTIIQQRDTAILNLNVVDSSVTGKLEYRRFEKDHNIGTIEGFVSGNMIVANYTFQSEGMTSVREVAFAIRNDSLFEGYGEIDVKNDTAKYVNTSQLKFMERPFVKVPCDN